MLVIIKRLYFILLIKKCTANCGSYYSHNNKTILYNTSKMEKIVLLRNKKDFLLITFRKYNTIQLAFIVLPLFYKILLLMKKFFSVVGINVFDIFIVFGDFIIIFIK